MVGMASSAQIAQNNKFSKSLQYLKKQLRDEMQMSITDLYKLILSFLMGVTRHA